MVAFGVSRAGWSRNNCRYFKLILGFTVSPHTKFHPNRGKNIKVENLTIGRFWLVGLLGRKMVTATSNIQIPSGGLQMTPVDNLNAIG